MKKKTEINNPKNRFDLDVAIFGSKLRWLCFSIFILCIVMLAWVINVSWWQWSLLILIILLLGIFYAKTRRPHRLISQQTDGIWLLQMNQNQSSVLIWQAYLNRIDLKNLGIGRALCLQFFVISPKKQHFDVVIFEDSVTKESFSKLVVLSNFYNC